MGIPTTPTAYTMPGIVVHAQVPGAVLPFPFYEQFKVTDNWK
jgi:hypothetical protein